jgi:putative membrane protein
LALPALQFHASEKTFLQALSLVVLLQVAFVLNALYRVWGWWGMLRAVVGVVLLSWIIQAIVIRSGLPYGSLTYTDGLQPQVLDVPLLIPLAWMMMLPAWGIYFLPLMVHLGFEQWNPAGGFSSVPWLHFLGWLLVSGVITFGLSPKRIPGGVLVLVYGLTWLVDFISLFVFWGLPGPAFAGLGMMGLMLAGAAIVNR